MFSEQQMNVLGHQHIAGDDKGVSLPDAFKLMLEDAVGAKGGQQRLPSITTEGDEVKDTAVLVADKALGHGK